MTIALINYETVLNRKKVGLCTNWLYENCKNKLDKSPIVNNESSEYIKIIIPFTIKLGDFPKISQSTSVILICIGTGIAPILNFLKDRFYDSDSSNNEETNINFGKTLLFYGCRNKDIDYLYSESILDYEKNKKLNFEVITSFSRDQKYKDYVQHKIKDEAVKVAELIFDMQSSIVLVGSSKFLPKAIDKAFIEIFNSQRNINETESINLLNYLKRTKRFYTETW